MQIFGAVTRRLSCNLPLIFILSLVFFASQAGAIETVVLKVYLNTVAKGDYFVVLTDDGDILIQPNDLHNLGIDSLAPEHQESVSLKSLAPKLQFTIIEAESALNITVDPRLLGINPIDIATRKVANIKTIHNNTAFFNYSISYRADSGFDYSSWLIPWEFGININDYFAFSSFSYSKSDYEEKLVRLFSNITWDNPAYLRRYIAGDFAAHSGILGSGGSLGGFSVSKNFSIDPYFTKYPGLDISGFIHTPSEIELYVNNLLVTRQDVPPGEFTIEDLTATAGSGETVIVIKDLYGREDVIVSPYYLSTRLLKQGIHEYSYNLGFKRKKFGQDSFNYEDLTFMGFHRYGFSNSFTPGVNAEFDSNVINGGTSIAFIPGNIGEMETAVSMSRDDEEYGYGGYLKWFYSGRNISGHISFKGLSEHYATLVIPEAQNKPRFEGLIGVGLHGKMMGSLSLSYAKSAMYSGDDIETIRLFYSRQLLKNMTLTFTASRSEADRTTDTFFANLSFYLGNSTTASFTYARHDGLAREGMTVQKTPPLGTGFGYRVQAENREVVKGDNDLNGTTYFQYRGAHGLYSLEAQKINEDNKFTGSIAGSLSYIDKSIYFSRPIDDSFALVDVEDLEGIKVLYNNQEIGTTNHAGELLVPQLASYHNNKLSIETKNIPFNYQINQTKQNVTVPFRGGGIVQFSVKKFQAVTGKIFFGKEGKRINAEFGGLDIQANGTNFGGIVGRGGDFYFENLPPGKFPARLYLADKECLFEITIPESTEIMIDTGEIVCEMD